MACFTTTVVPGAVLSHTTHGMDGMVVVVVGGRGGGSGWMSESEKGLVDKKPPTQHSESPRPAWWWWLTKGHTHWCACPWSLTCVVWCGMRWVCVDCVVSNGKHHCVCVWLVACECEWHGVGTTQHALVSVVVHVACVCGSGASTKSRLCVCGRWWHKSVGGGGGRDGVVVGGVGGTHSPHPHHHAPPWRPPPVPLCMCV